MIFVALSGGVSCFWVIVAASLSFAVVVRIRRGRFSGCHGSMSKIEASEIEILMAAQISPCRAQKASHGNVGVV